MNQNKSPVIVTDSGAGGLIILKKLAQAFPSERFIYYSDENNLPYGNKTIKQIEKFCRKRIAYAQSVGAKLLVVACNTMSVIGKRIFSESNIKVIDVIAPSLLFSKDYPLPALVFCTIATSKSEPISRLSHIKGYKIVPLGSLAKDIEDNLENLAKVRLELPDEDYDEYNTVVLGCTHYSLIAEMFKKRFKVTVVDGSEQIIERVECVLGKRGCSVEKFIKKPKFVGSGARRLSKVYDKLFSDMV